MKKSVLFFECSIHQICPYLALQQYLLHYLLYCCPASRFQLGAIICVVIIFLV
uniref:Uncharacterized protein n=1 Tax=Anguilla anguilla TaxID=7936 RepID=A0A0E9RW99_ANGAN